ncbi:MAG: AmpG family muropeptide MFS transporter [Pseudomonadales bacterium]|nr:AmpG family muropeptide MFS transporter [Pseudomonadales bacterium]
MTEPWSHILFSRRMLICVISGFSSGLPLFMFVYLLPAWLRSAGLNLTSIGLTSLLMMPYALKVLWAPWVDRWSITSLGRRRSWILCCLLGLIVAFIGLGWTPPHDLGTVSAWSLLISLLSASQDTALDALRREILPDNELGLGSSLHVNAYKIAGLVPGSLALVLSDIIAWPWVFMICSLFLLPGIAMSLLMREPASSNSAPHSLREAIIFPFKDFLERHGEQQTLLILLLVMTYKLGDGLATTLATPFYLDMGFSRSTLGLVAKQAGLIASVTGGLVGGFGMLRLGIVRALWIYGILQASSILGFWWLSLSHHGVFALAGVIAGEAFGVGLGTTALVAYMAQQTSMRYTATQFALLTSMAALPRSLINASSGWLVEHLGWSHFYLLCLLLSIPGLFLLLSVLHWPKVNSRGEKSS